LYSDKFGDKQMIGFFGNYIVLISIIFSSPLLQAQEAMQNILIYSGPGVGPQSLKNTVAMIKHLVAGKYKIITVGPDVLIDPTWIRNTALLVMPGGADRPYVEKLQGAGNENIKTYVANGGKFLGICAGAYYSADRIEFAKGDKDLEVTGERELKFFPGLVVGPTYSGFDHRDITIFAGTRAAKLFWQLEQPFAANKEFVLFYNGGGNFIDPEKYSNVRVLARYNPEAPGETKRHAAIIECTVGKGRAILSSPHFEWDPETLDTKITQLNQIKPSLVAANNERMALARHLFARLGIHGEF
jgi:biotin--protein ligase